MLPDLNVVKAQLKAVLTEFQNVPVSKDGIPDMKRTAELQGQLFAIQLEAQDMSLKTELLSKLAEHGTSSTKTVLQTQA